LGRSGQYRSSYGRSSEATRLMPLYEYLCNNPDCDTDTFEVLANYDETIERCPDCKEGTRDRKTFYQFDFHMQ